MVHNVILNACRVARQTLGGKQHQPRVLHVMLFLFGGGWEPAPSSQRQPHVPVEVVIASCSASLLASTSQAHGMKPYPATCRYIAHTRQANPRSSNCSHPSLSVRFVWKDYLVRSKRKPNGASRPAWWHRIAIQRFDIHVHSDATETNLAPLEPLGQKGFQNAFVSWHCPGTFTPRLNVSCKLFF